MQIKFLQRSDQSLFFKKLSCLTLRHRCSRIIFSCIYFIPGLFCLSFQICITESINASTNIWGESFFVWMKIMARNVHSDTLSASPQKIQMSKVIWGRKTKEDWEGKLFFLTVHIYSIKWEPCMSNSKWKRVKDILEYKKEVLSLRKIDICKILDSHTVEEVVNCISHWKCSCLGISIVLTTYLIMDMILCPFCLCPVTRKLEIKCLGKRHSKFWQLGINRLQNMLGSYYPYCIFFLSHHWERTQILSKTDSI